MTVVGLEHTQQRLVGVGHTPAGIERKYSGRDAFKNGLHLPAALFKFGVRRAQVTAGSLDLTPADF